ncbi:MAG: hypothetical protein ACR2P0_10435 [Acidimicrobiales bacterium]
MMRHRKSWLGAWGVVVLLLAGCGESGAGVSGEDVVAVDDGPSTDDGAVETTDAPTDQEESVDTADGEAADATGDSAKDPAAPISAESVYDADAEPNLAWFAPFEPGAYRTGALGTPMSFTANETLNTQPNGGGMFVLSDVASRAPDDRDLVFMRVGAFSDPSAPNAPIEDQTPWPNEDFLGWLENLSDDVIATEPVETTVNGLAAIRVDLSISDDVECGWVPGFCVGLIENNGQDIHALNKGASYRVWIVEQGDEDPLAIVVGIARDEDSAWFERADAVMDTIAFGDIAPNPVQRLVAGPNSLNTLGGIEVSLPDNLEELTNGRSRLINLWTGRGFARIEVTDEPGAVFFADRPHGLDGNALGTADDVVAQLTAAGADLTELGDTTIGGGDARVFDVTTEDVGAIMLRFSPLDVNEDFLGWDAPAAGRIWLIEHPDRGLMMISAHAFEDVDAMLPRVTELGEAIVASLTFTP